MATEIIDVPQGLEPDHRDRNVHNMLKENLRAITHQQNCENKGIYKNNTSGFLGVFWCQTSWGYKITRNGQRIRKSGFATAQAAHEARQRKLG